MLTPRETERLTWDCTVNTRGGAGNNVFLDLDLEHDNHYVTELLRGLGEMSVKQVSAEFVELSF